MSGKHPLRPAAAPPGPLTLPQPRVRALLSPACAGLRRAGSLPLPGFAVAFRAFPLLLTQFPEPGRESDPLVISGSDSPSVLRCPVSGLTELGDQGVFEKLRGFVKGTQ